MNEFFRCPRWVSGNLILLFWAIIFLCIAAFIDTIGLERLVGFPCATYLVQFTLFVGSILWFFWNVWNIKQHEVCYKGFDGNGPFSYLNIWKRTKP